MSDHDILPPAELAVDERLRADAARFQAAVRDAPVPDLLTGAGGVSGAGGPGSLRDSGGLIDILPSRTRPTWLVPLAAAAGVLAVVIGVAVGRGAPEATPGTRTPTPSTTEPTVTAPAGAVPWADLPATGTTIPVTTHPASPDPALAVGLPPCTAAQVASVTPDAGGAAAGTLYLTYRLHLRGTTPCRLEGRPVVDSYDGARRLDVRTTAGQGPTAYDGPVRLGPGADAVVALSTPSCHGAPVNQTTVRIHLPGGGTVEATGFGRLDACSPEESSTPRTFGVDTFAPAERQEARTESAYASLAEPVTEAVEGGYTVTLEPSRDIVLVPCPDYRVEVYGDGPDFSHTWALNCAGVSTRDDLGRPVLRAGTPTTFFFPAAPSGNKRTWRLVIPDPTGVALIPDGAASSGSGSRSPSPSSTPSAEPSGAAYQPCRADQVRAGRSERNGATGHSLRYDEVRLVGETPCTLSGTPEVAALDHGTDLRLPQEAPFFPPSTTGPVVLTPGAPGMLAFDTYSCMGLTSVDITTLRVFLAGGFVDLPGFGPQTCTDVKEPRSIGVSPWQSSTLSTP